MKSGYQLPLDGLFDDVETIHTDEDCCDGPTIDGQPHHIPHCPTYHAAVRAHDEAREQLAIKNPQRDVPPLQTTTHVRITVRGLPAPQGSKDAFPIWEGTGRYRRLARIALVEVADKKVKAWRKAVKHACETHRHAFPARAPLAVECFFSIPRPATVTPAERMAPVVPPDADKYLRGTLDALVLADVFPDDAQVLRAAGEKHYAGQGRGPEHPGAYITISRVLT